MRHIFLATYKRNRLLHVTLLVCKNNYIAGHTGPRIHTSPAGHTGPRIPYFDSTTNFHILNVNFIPVGELKTRRMRVLFILMLF